MIVAGKNGFTKNAYRRFNIQNPNVMGDDFGMMREVLSRRLKDKKDLPDLMIIDGGKGQISAVQAVLDDMQLPLKIIGVAKGEKRNAGDEKIVFADEREDVKLPHNSPLLFFIERLRDEAHRFAIGTHRARRAKSMLANPLDEIEGVGAVRKKALLAHFGSAKAVMAASVFELEKVKGISKDEAQKIYDFFR
jgi:excinuclease ABC subunit C